MRSSWQTSPEAAATRSTRDLIRPTARGCRAPSSVLTEPCSPCRRRRGRYSYGTSPRVRLASVLPFSTSAFSGTPHYIALSRDGAMFAASGQTRVLLLDVRRGEQLGTFDLTGPDGVGIAFGEGDRALLFAHADGRIDRIVVDPAGWAERACAIAWSAQAHQRWGGRRRREPPPRRAACARVRRSAPSLSRPRPTRRPPACA
jgi:hypothetical protein